jgi:HSP20 family protein
MTTMNTIARPVAPAADIFETDSDYQLYLDVPGAPRETIKVELDGRELRVYAPRPGADMADFERSFTLPAGLGEGAVEAELKAGVLGLRIAKPAAMMPRTIEIQG